MKPLVALAAVGVALAMFYGLGLEQFLSVETLQGNWDTLVEMKQGSPGLFMAAGFLSYAAVAAFSIPGALAMTLAMGALFGVAEGAFLVSFASSVGATIAFLISRFVFRDVVRARFADRLKAIDDGMRKDGALYLFTLRMVPVFPFFLVNLLLGLTPMRTRTFYWVSQVGMFPATLVVVNAGAQLSKFHGPSGLISPGLLASFAMIGVLPILSRRAMEWLKRKKVYSRWKKPSRFDRNLIVIGGGAAGLVSAYVAAAVRAKVTLVETHKMGGDCLNYGCVPSKALIKSAKLVQQIRNGRKYGLNGQVPDFRFSRVMQRVNDVISSVAPHDSVERYTKLGVEVLEGYARILDPWTVEIKSPDGNVNTLTTRSIIVATGAAPFIPPLPGLDEVGYLTSDTLWKTFSELEDPPARLVVLGGGPIGCELAQSFARLGSKVIQVEMAPRILLREDPEVSEIALRSLENDGVEVLTGHKAVRCEIQEGEKTILVEHDGQIRPVHFDALICAVGRNARLKGYGLEELGIQVQRNIVVNDYLETVYPNIYAAGDVAGPYQFTHTAAHQAWHASVNALFGGFKRFKVDYSVIPWATFIDPEVARVGVNEQEAKERGISYEVTRYGIDDLDRAIADSSTEGFVKVLTVPGRDRILGVTIVGEHAGDLLQEFVLAMKHGLGLNKILGTIHAYPTLSEANKSVAGMWKQKHAPKRLLNFVARFHAWSLG